MTPTPWWRWHFNFAVCYFATLKTGAIAVSVNPMLKSYELKYILNDSGAVLLFTVGELLEVRSAPLHNWR